MYTQKTDQLYEKYSDVLSSVCNAVMVCEGELAVLRLSVNLTASLSVRLWLGADEMREQRLSGSWMLQQRRRIDKELFLVTLTHQVKKVGDAALPG